MNPVFSTKAFWQPYLTLESDDLTESGFAAQLDGFRGEYAVRDEPIHFEVLGQQCTAIRHVVEFPFSCGERFSMIIEYEPSVYGCSKNLFLIDSHLESKSQMGWWDLARWHPYCLRPEEFDALLMFWSRWDRRWQGQELPLLLHCQFVGLADSIARDSLTARAEVALRALDLPETGEDQPTVSLVVPEAAYRWEYDEERGWVFTSDDYCCYSIRNRPHEGSDEGEFPFKMFQEMMSEIERRLDRT